MMKALWLTSWYPNKLDAMNGDFIQRHARAASLFCKVHVIHLEPDKEEVLTAKKDVSVSKKDNLTEVIVLYKLLRNFGPLSRLLSYFNHISLFKKLVRGYIKENGLPDVVHVHVPMKAGILALWMKKKYGVPYAVTEHWAIYNQSAPDAFFKRSFLFRSLTKKILKHSSAFMPVSRNLGEAVQKMVVNIPFTVVPNVVDTNFFNYTEPSPVDNLIFTFLHVSTLNYQKNPEAILRAYKNFSTLYPAAKLVMTGHAGDALLQYTAGLNIPPQNIIFTGLVGYKEVAGIMKTCNALVMFSLYENLPCVIIEALCSGLPIISTNVGGINEVVEESNGLLLNNSDEEGLLVGMIKLYNNYTAYNRAEIAEQACRKFSYDTVGKSITDVYMDIIRK